MTNATPSAKVALVTGASRGIGAAIAKALGAAGYQVIGTATTDDGAGKISQALAAFPGSRGVALDVNNGAAVEALIDLLHQAEHHKFLFYPAFQHRYDCDQDAIFFHCLIFFQTAAGFVAEGIILFVVD